MVADGDQSAAAAMERPCWQAARASRADQERRLLFVQFTAEQSGSPISGLMTVKGLLRNGWQVDVVFGRSGPIARQYQESGCTVHLLAHGDWLSGERWWQQARRWAREAGAVLRFRRLMRSVKPQVVYVNNLTGVAAAVAARMLSIPCVWHLRELFDDVGGEMVTPVWGGRRLVGWAVSRLAAQIVSVSRAVRDNVVGDRARGRVRIIRNAALPAYFEECRSAAECRSLLELPQDVPIVGVPGTLRPMKGHEFFLKAAALVLQEIPSCVFAITGTGSPRYRADLDTIIGDTLLKKRVRFLGSVEDMAASYRACDALCVPSRGDPFPRTVIEPFAVGTPVVGTAVGGIPEAIEHEKTGLLVEYGDVEGLAQALVRLLRDPALRQRLAAGARAKALAEYREDLYQERIQSIIDEVIRSWTASRRV